jgi:hypothetical protein
MRLSQNLAIEADVRKQVDERRRVVDDLLASPQMFEGFTKTYTPKEDEGETQPPQGKRVQARVSDVLASLSLELGRLFDVTATKDWANTQARADVKVGETVILTQAPATFLLWLSKRLEELDKLRLPTLDAEFGWEFDKGVGLHKTNEVKTLSSKKLSVPLTLYDATDKHPAQTQLVTEDKVVGTWTAVNVSGALSEEQVRAIKMRLRNLLAAVRSALEEANTITVTEHKVGEDILKYVFG